MKSIKKLSTERSPKVTFVSRPFSSNPEDEDEELHEQAVGQGWEQFDENLLQDEWDREREREKFVE